MPPLKQRAIAIVGVGAVLPNAPNAPAYLANLKQGRYCISDTPKERWDPDLYYDPDPLAPDKTYSRIGGWVRDYEWDPLAWRLPIPPKVAEAMDLTQKWSIIASREALTDYGYPNRPLDEDRTAVVFGNAMGGEQHYLTSLRLYYPEFARELGASPTFAGLPPEVREAMVSEFGERVAARFPPTTEDTMPGELGNIVAGRVANLFNFHGPNFITDAACASALAAIDAAIEGLENNDYDAVLTGGIDANMGPNSFIKFCKIGALSATGTRPYHDGADGFVMGEGAAVFLMKRLEDAERDGDRIYAVVRGIGGSSDGRGKGITAPNPVGQEFAVSRAWRNAGIAPDSATYVEGHGTSTKVGDVVEAEALSRVFADLGLKPGSIPLGSVKSNIGHLKSSAGAAGLLKAAFSLDQKLLFPSLGDTGPNPGIDFANSPLYISKELDDWKVENGRVRSAAVSAFGFGGTNFHVVMEEYVPGRIKSEDGERSFAVSAPAPRDEREGLVAKAPYRGALVIGDTDQPAVVQRLRTALEEARAGRAPAPGAPSQTDLQANVRIAIDYGSADELATKIEKALSAIEGDKQAMWKALNNQGVFMGEGTPGLVAFLYTGQGSQYINMLAEFRERDSLVAELFDAADQKMFPMLGRPLTDYIFIDPDDRDAVKAAEDELRHTEITQPAVLTVDLALTRVLGSYGIKPDMVMGHSLGEYGALVAAGAMPFTDSLEAVAGRGREMSKIQVEDNGLMAAVFAPIEEVQEIVDSTEGYVVVANINSNRQSVIGGATAAVEAASKRLSEAGRHVIPLSVSHAFHTDIVSPASEPLKELLRRLRVESAEIPIIANVTGEFYPRGPDVSEQMIEILGKQVASPVQFVKGLETLYEAGARVFVEVGPKRALQGFVNDMFASDPSVVAIATNHPRQGDLVSFNYALCGLYAAGLGATAPSEVPSAQESATIPAAETTAVEEVFVTPPPAASTPSGMQADTYAELGKLFADFLQKGNALLSGTAPAPTPATQPIGAMPPIYDAPVVVTGAAVGLPGRERVFADDNVAAILHGDQFIDSIPTRFRRLMTDKHITRLVKSKEGGGHFEDISSQADVIKLAGRAGALDLVEEFGFPEERIGALERTSRLAIAAGIDALRDAGIPLAMHYKSTTTGTKLPERWMLPQAYRDTTGVIFASAFPGADGIVAEVERFNDYDALHRRLEDLQSLRSRVDELGAGALLVQELDRRIHELEAEITDHEYHFDRKFLFHAVAFGHAQFAEYIGARGPNTQVNAACASTTQAVAIAEDWIRAGRCDRVIVISADDVTSDTLLEWIGSGFLAVGAAATDDAVEDAALPFDRRRHGMILGMGAAALVVESAASAAQRGVRPISEVLSTITANSAFHGSRLDTSHIRFVMQDLLETAERRWGVDRHQIAPRTVFISHETYTPARGGSAQAEIDALRHVFGDSAERIVISNTKGFTGHAMGVGVEDVVAVKALETGIAPPVPNYREPDPDLGRLNLSKGGSYPLEYALRLGAGFGSQISMTLYRWVPSPTGVHQEPSRLGFEYRVDQAAYDRWLSQVSGIPGAQTETVSRTLRIRDNGAPTAAPEVEKPEPVRSPEPRIPSPEVPVVSPQPVPSPEPRVASPQSQVSSPQSQPAPAAVVSDEVRDTVLAVVAEQTGYPPEMLDLDLDLEADLGVDTVKQAETFAAIRDRYGIERDDNLALRDYPTLQHVIDFVYDRAEGVQRPSTVASPQSQVSSPQSQPAPASEAPAAGLLEGDDDQAATIPRRIPTAVLRPSLDVCATTGVELDSTARVVVFGDSGGVGKALVKQLSKQGVDVLHVADRPTVDELLASIDAFGSDGPITGVYWLPALDDPGPVSELTYDEWKEELRVRVKLLYATMRHLYETVGSSGTFLLSATRLGGKHGYDDSGALSPLGGAVTGFTKAYKREKPDALVKAVDFAPSRKTTALAKALIEETLHDPGAVEIGRYDDMRWTVAVDEVDLPVETTIELGSDSVFVITGAAGSIVSAITADLARASQGTFHLLDLVELPSESDADVAAFGSDKEGLKRTIFERLKESGERATPALVDRELAAIERRHAARSAVSAIESVGGTVHYHSVNLLDGDAVAAVAASIRETSGKVDLLLHAAGLEISRKLPDKEPREYDLVFDVKADGWFNLMKGLGDLPITSTVAFSSVAGRFGNNGQTDYSAANDLLCKLTSNFKTSRPDTLGVAIDWTAWGDIGMATRGSIPTVMKTVGIDMLPARAGIPIVRREVTRRGVTGEVVIGQRLGILLEEFDPTGGLQPGTLDGGVLVEAPEAFGIYCGLTARATFDPGQQPFLYDHRIDGTPVLPGVMGMELFAESARLGFPDLVVTAIEDVDFLAPFKFYRDEPRTVTIGVTYRRDGDDVVASCKLTGERVLPNSPEPQITTHFAGKVRLGASRSSSRSGDPVEVRAGVGAPDIYEVYFHGPAYQVIGEAWSTDGGAASSMNAELPPNQIPEDADTVIAPRLAELCFQTAGIWEIGTTGVMALPTHVERLTLTSNTSEGHASLFAVATPNGGGFDVRVVTGQGDVVAEMTGYRTVALPAPIDDALAEPIQKAMTTD